MKLKNIMTLAHKIAKELNLVGSYTVKMKIALKTAHEIAKAKGRLTATTHVEICDNHTNISDSYNALANKKGFFQGFFLGNVMDFEETQGQKFTRLALENFRNNAA